MIPAVASALRDVPSLSVLCEILPDDANAVRFIEKIKWPEGFVCSRCGSTADPYSFKGWLVGRTCRACHKSHSISIVYRVQLPPRKWIAGIWLVAIAKESALPVCRVLGTTYETAYNMKRTIEAEITTAHRMQNA